MTSNYYSRFRMFDGDTRIERFFNSVMSRMQMMRSFSAPHLLSSERTREDAAIADTAFADFCRYEIWMHSVVERLKEWIEVIDEYFNEFEGSWKYFAAARRIQFMREFLGEDGDCETEGLEDEDYWSSSIVTKILAKDMMDPAKVLPVDVASLCACLTSCAQMHMPSKIKEMFDADIKVCKLENGEFKELTQTDIDLSKAEAEADAEDDSKRIFAICGGVHAILRTVEKLKYNEDNREVLKTVRELAGELLNMNFGKMHEIVAKLAREEEENDAKNASETP